MLINSIINNYPYIKNSYSVNFGRRNQLSESDNFKKRQKKLPIDNKPKSNCKNTNKPKEQKDIEKVPVSSKFNDMPYETRRIANFCAFKQINVRHIWYLRDLMKPEDSIKMLTELAEETENEFGNILYGSDKTTFEYYVLRKLLNDIHNFIDKFRKSQKPEN